MRSYQPTAEDMAAYTDWRKQSASKPRQSNIEASATKKIAPSKEEQAAIDAVLNDVYNKGQ